MGEFSANFSLDDLVGNLSRAQQALVGIMRALDVADSPMHALVLDEPTVGLPPSEVQLVLDTVVTLSQRQIAVVLVSHALDDVQQVCHSVTVLRDGVVVLDAPSTIGHTRIVEAITGVVHAPSGPEFSTYHPAGNGEAALIVENLRGERLHGVSLRVEPGEILGVAGGLDSGVDSLLPSIFGDLPATADSVQVAGRPVRHWGSPGPASKAGVAFVPADRLQDSCMSGMSLKENLTGGNLKDIASRLVIRHRRERLKRLTLLADYAIQPRQLAAPIESFSGGNQQKTMLARCLRTNPWIVLIDQPTQGVDIGGKAAIHQRLARSAAAGAAFIVCSSEVEELAEICQRVVILQQGVVVDTLSGDRLTAAAIIRAMFTGKGTSPDGLPRTPPAAEEEQAAPS